VQTVWNNGGSLTSHLAYTLDEEDEEEPQDEQLGFETSARAPVTQSLDNLVPANKYKKIDVREGGPEYFQLGPHTAKIFSNDDDGFNYYAEIKF
jgi:hypothetical protein